jgi:hypothetical protein
LSDIKHVVVTVRQPSGARGDLGSVAEGFFRVSEDGVLTMVTATGEPLRGVMGERLTARLDGEHERTVASRLVLAHWRSSQDDASDFNSRRLTYPRTGWV